MSKITHITSNMFIIHTWQWSWTPDLDFLSLKCSSLGSSSRVANGSVVMLSLRYVVRLGNNSSGIVNCESDKFVSFIFSSVICNRNVRKYIIILWIVRIFTTQKLKFNALYILEHHDEQSSQKDYNPNLYFGEAHQGLNVENQFQCLFYLDANQCTPCKQVKKSKHQTNMYLYLFIYVNSNKYIYET